MIPLATSNKQQATSNKQQATSNKQQEGSFLPLFCVHENTLFFEKGGVL
ncbi:hypothetical protein OJ917_09165 [Streptococcus anginosus]|nr:hypothetical protein [Streptococcus anginosus]